MTHYFISNCPVISSIATPGRTSISRHHQSYLINIFTVSTNPSSKTGGARNEGIPMLITFHFDSSKYYPISPFLWVYDEILVLGFKFSAVQFWCVLSAKREGLCRESFSVSHTCLQLLLCSQ